MIYCTAVTFYCTSLSLCTLVLVFGLQFLLGFPFSLLMSSRKKLPDCRLRMHVAPVDRFKAHVWRSLMKTFWLGNAGDRSRDHLHQPESQ